MHVTEDALYVHHSDDYSSDVSSNQLGSLLLKHKQHHGMQASIDALHWLGCNCGSVRTEEKCA